jgi:hypothetical protein
VREPTNPATNWVVVSRKVVERNQWHERIAYVMKAEDANVWRFCVLGCPDNTDVCGLTEEEARRLFENEGPAS